MPPPVDIIRNWFRKSEAPKKPRTGEGGVPLKPDSKHVMAYGDQLNDGAVQLSFTLPIPPSPEAKEAAKLYVEKLGLHEVHVATMESIGMGFSFFVVYGKSKHAFDFTKVKVPKAAFEKMDFDAINDYAREKIGKRLTIVGATTGTDAHTVGIDAIMNMKGYSGDYGLERYPCFRAVNLRSQVDPDELLRRAEALRADVILVSKVVTQRGEYQKELQDLAKKLKSAKKLPSPLIQIAGGPRMTHAEAVKLGFDAGFGPGTLPSEVASFIVQEYAKRAK